MEKAYETGDEAAVMSLRARNSELTEVFELPFTSIIGWAARNGATNLLAELIRNGDHKQNSESPFHGSGVGDAAAGGWARCVRMLLDGGADPMGSTAFQGSAIGQSIETWNQQFAIGDPMEQKQASRAEREESVRLLLKAGVNLLAPPASQDSNLVSSVFSGLPPDSKALVELLLTNAIPARQVSPLGDTLLHAAAFLASTQSLATLVQRGGDVRVTNRLGWTPLHSVAATWATDGTLQAYSWSQAYSSLPKSIAWSPGFLLGADDRRKISTQLIRYGARHDVFSAAGLGDLAVLKGLLAESPRDVTARDARGRTALHWAALGNQPKAIAFLMGAGSDPAALDADGNSALHLSLLRWPSKGFVALLAAKAPLDQPNKNGDAPLGWATYNPEAVLKLLEAGARPNPDGAEPPLLGAVHKAAKAMFQLAYVRSSAFRPGGSPVSLGSMGGVIRHMPPNQVPLEMECVLRLLRAGASPGAAGRDASTPLEVACEASLLNLIEVLVRAGADLQSRDATGDPAWFHVLQKSAESVYVEHPGWKFPVTPQESSPAGAGLEKKNLQPIAPMIRPEAVLGFLTRLGAQITATNRAGQNALHVLGRGGRKDRIDEITETFGFGSPLLARGDRTNAQTARIESLVQSGLSLESRDLEGNTPWLIAWRYAQTEVAEQFVRAGANTRTTNHAGMNALHLICLPRPGTNSAKFADMPRFIGPVVGHLVKQGVDPKAQDAQGRTPLHYAIAAFHPTFVAVELVEAGADPRVRDAQGRTPLALAEEAGRADLVAFFKDPKNANPFTTPQPRVAPTPP
jgi:ankyrin repeat protein